MMFTITTLYHQHKILINDKHNNDTHHNDTQHNDTQHNDTQHNDTQHNDTQHNDTQHNDTQHNDIHHKRLIDVTQHKQHSALMTLSITILYNHHKILINDNQYNDT